MCVLFLSCLEVTKYRTKSREVAFSGFRGKYFNNECSCFKLSNCVY